MGVVVRRYIDILTIIIDFPYSTCISSFFGSSIPTSLFIFKIYKRALRPSGRPASNLVPQRVPLNAQCANVGPASNDSKVNNIALKTATLFSRFS